MDDDRIDLSALDPSRAHPERWEQRLQTVTARAVTLVQPQRDPLLEQLLRWLGPAVALAAGVATVVWLGALRHRPSSGPLGYGSAGASDPVVELLAWSERADLPTTDRLMDLGETHGNR